MSRRETKDIKFITESVANHVEDFFNRNIEKLVARTGYNFKVASVGGQFNKERLVLEIGLLPSDAKDHRIRDMQEDLKTKHRTKHKKDTSAMAEKLSKKTGYDKRIIKPFLDNWYDNQDNLKGHIQNGLKVGSKLEHNDKRFVLIGFHMTKDKIVLYNISTRKFTLSTIKSVYNMDLL